MVLRLRDGRKTALTNTCAAVALGVVHPGDYAAVGADADAAVAGFELAGRHLGLAGPEVARRMLTASSQAVGDLIVAVADEYELRAPTVVAVGGGAVGSGGSSPPRWVSSVRSRPGPKSSPRSATHCRLGADRARTLDRVAAEPKTVPRSAAGGGGGMRRGRRRAGVGRRARRVRARALHAARDRRRARWASKAARCPDANPSSSREATEISTHHGLPEPVAVGSFWIAAGPGADADGGQVLVLDRFGDAVSEGWGSVVALSDAAAAARVGQLAKRFTRHVGPMTMPPTIWLLDASRLIGLAPADADDACLAHAGTRRTPPRSSCATEPSPKFGDRPD